MATTAPNPNADEWVAGYLCGSSHGRRSANPHAPATDAGRTWTAGFIDGELSAGRPSSFSDEDYRAAGLKPPPRGIEGAPPQGRGSWSSLAAPDKPDPTAILDEEPPMRVRWVDGERTLRMDGWVSIGFIDDASTLRYTTEDK